MIIDHDPCLALFALPKSNFGFNSIEGYCWIIMYTLLYAKIGIGLCSFIIFFHISGRSSAYRASLVNASWRNKSMMNHFILNFCIVKPLARHSGRGGLCCSCSRTTAPGWTPRCFQVRGRLKQGPPWKWYFLERRFRLWVLPVCFCGDFHCNLDADFSHFGQVRVQPWVFQITIHLCTCFSIGI